MEIAAEPVLPHTLIQEALTRRAWLRIEEPRRGDPNDKQGRTSQLRDIAEDPNGIGLCVDRVLIALAANPILANGENLPAADDHGHVGVGVVLGGVATFLAEDIRVQVLVHPCWEQRSRHGSRLLLWGVGMQGHCSPFDR